MGSCRCIGVTQGAVLITLLFWPGGVPGLRKTQTYLRCATYFRLVHYTHWLSFDPLRRPSCIAHSACSPPTPSAFVEGNGPSLSHFLGKGLRRRRTCRHPGAGAPHAQPDRRFLRERCIFVHDGFILFWASDQTVTVSVESLAGTAPVPSAGSESGDADPRFPARR